MQDSRDPPVVALMNPVGNALSLLSRSDWRRARGAV
jgi:hypothetical protein